MKPALQIFMQKLQMYLILALGTVPVPVLLFAYFGAHLLKYVWVYPMLYMILALLSLKIPGKMRAAYGIGGILFFLISGLLVPDKVMGTRELVLVIGLFYGVLLMLSLQIAGWSRDREIPVTYAGYCLIPHLIGQYLIILDSTLSEALGIAAPWLTAALFVFVGLVMLSMNRSSIKGIVGRRRDSYVAIRGKNTLLTLGLFGSAMLASLIPSSIGTVLSSLGWGFNRLLKLFDLLIMDMPATIPPESIPVTTEPEITQTLPIIPTDREGARTTYVILVVLAVLIVIPLAIFALIQVWKALKKFGSSFWGWFQRILSDSSEAYYEDEITDTRAEDQTERARKKRDNRLKIVFANEQKMTAGQRIRHRYRRLAMRHKEWSRGSTARENLPEEAAELYERSRYSDHPISEEDALLFKKTTKEL